jgi:hypothetical protein
VLYQGMVVDAQSSAPQDFCAAVAREAVLRLSSTASAAEFSRQHLSNTMCVRLARYVDLDTTSTAC